MTPLQGDDVQRPTPRLRANTSAFVPFVWPRRRTTESATIATSTEPIQPPPFENLIELLTPPSVPSLNNARALTTVLVHQSPMPRLVTIMPVLASLCNAANPINLQAAGYDILAAYWENSGSASLPSADRLSCLSLFSDMSAPWSQELWEPKFKAFVALINSGTATVGMEASLLRILEDWIEEVFVGLQSEEKVSSEEHYERQRSVEAMTRLLMALVRRPEFVARLSEHDTNSVLQLFGNLIRLAFSESSDNTSDGRPVSTLPDVTLVSPISPSRISLRHHRHQSSLSISQVHTGKSDADLAVELYLEYLSIRLKAIAPVHLSTILPHLFCILGHYASPLPRISLSSSEDYVNEIEKRVGEVLDSLVTGPYSASCTVILKQHLFPLEAGKREHMRTSLGALRTLRASIRRALVIRLARSYISKTSSMNYTPSGAPGSVDLQRDLMERAWAKDDIATWDLNRFRGVLCRAANAWIQYDRGIIVVCHTSNGFCEAILTEITGILKDITQAFDETGDELDYEEVEAVGDILKELVAFVRMQQNSDGTPVRIAISQMDVPMNFLTTLSALLAQDPASLYTILPSIILSIAQHVTDEDTNNLLKAMTERQSFSPTSPVWLDNWRAVLSIPDLYSTHRQKTRKTVLDTLQSVWDFVKDVAVYRRPLAAMVFGFWREQTTSRREDHATLVIWRILGDEIVLRRIEELDRYPLNEADDGVHNLADNIISFLAGVASEPFEDETDAAIAEVTAAPAATSVNTSVAVSPAYSRMQSEYSSPTREKESTMPSVMSLLSSLTSGNSSRSHSQPRNTQSQSDIPELLSSPGPESSSIPKAVGAVVSLVSAFSQLAFTSLTVLEDHLELATRLFKTLVSLLGGTACTKAKLTILQFMMRLRVDRSHRLYFASKDYDRDGLIASLAALIGRGEKGSSAVDMHPMDDMESTRRARPREAHARVGRRLSRGRGGKPSASESSRSRSRAPSRVVSASMRHLRSLEPLWTLPESLPFLISAEADTPSERLSSFDPAGPAHKVILPLSTYLAQCVNIIKSGRDWELLSYVLCHLPTQLSNKHLFCGPRSRVVLNDLLVTICNAIHESRFAGSVERWPDNIIPRDAQGLVYHTLTVLISYKQCFRENIQFSHGLVESFLLGLHGQPATIRCCLNALSISAFELQSSMTKYLPRILEKLSQIMSNPVMAVHIIDFLAIVGSCPVLYSNFTESDYKMVFGVALQYLQLHTRQRDTLNIPWVLSQHVSIMSYYIVYLWFLAVKLPDRPRHIKFIARQLLLANEENEEVDEPTEVCFDWLARYTYASADPRPANSMLNDIVMKPLPAELSAASIPSISEKTWVLGNSVVTIRALERRGWVEVVSRRASGLTKFLCRAENVPMVTPGDVDPDMTSIAASLTMDRSVHDVDISLVDCAAIRESTAMPSDAPAPDAITGYVWSGSAPSQRRKEVAIDPSYFALQLSSYPDSRPSSLGRIVADTSKLAGFFRSLDRLPVIDTHKVGILYVAPGQTKENDILGNTHGSPAYARFLEGLGRLINLRGQVDVYAGGLDPDEDGEYAYAWWDDIGQILYHTATQMPSGDEDDYTNKKRHIGNDWVRIVWNDSGLTYRFDTLSTQFQFVNIVIEPHSRGALAAYSHNLHENEYFKLTVQRAAGMPEFTPIGEFKLISADNLPLLVRQLSLLADWFVQVFQQTKGDTERLEMTTNWRARLQYIKRFRVQLGMSAALDKAEGGVMDQEAVRDFTTLF